MRPRAPFNVLIVEDEALVSMDLEAMVQDCGHRVIGDARSLLDVEAMRAHRPPDLAFVDMHLADDSSGLDVCAWIRRHWPTTAVVFVTANPDVIPADFAGAYGVIPKPFSRVGLARAMEFICQGLSEPPPVAGRPASFTPSPAIAAAWSP